MLKSNFKKIGLGILGGLAAIALLVLASPPAHATNPSILSVQGTTAAGSAAAAPPVQVGGSDGTNIRKLLTDTSGRPMVVGAAAVGATGVGDPVLFGLVDINGKVRSFLGDIGGRLIAGNVDRATYNYSTLETVPTSAQALMAIEADGTNKIRLRYLKICTSVGALQTTAGNRQLVLYATTAPSASGSATAVPNPVDPADAAFTGVARTGALTTTTAIGSIAAAQAIWETSIFLPAAATTAGTCVEKAWGTSEGIKPPTTGVAVTSGLALGDLTGGSGGTGSYTISATFTNEPN